MGATTKILTGLALGVATGLFLGEQAWPFRYAADAFVRLLEMTVLPYLTVSLIAGIGSLDPVRAKTLFLRVGALTLGYLHKILSLKILTLCRKLVINTDYQVNYFSFQLRL